MSRYAPKGKWFIKVFDSVTKRSHLLTYDGFNTKQEAEDIAFKLNVISDSRYRVTVTE